MSRSSAPSESVAERARKEEPGGLPEQFRQGVSEGLQVLDQRVLLCDDAVKCKNASKGALLIRNSWGMSWGEHGYGYLPYDYVLKGLAEDFWVMIKAEWVDTKAFA